MRSLGLSESPRGYRRRSAGAIYDAHYGPNMTPMVDVVMVILIFFMASAAVLGPDWFLKSALPVQGRSAVEAKDAPVRVRLSLRVDQGKTGVWSTTAWPVGPVGGGPAELVGSSLEASERLLREVEAAAGGRKVAVIIEPADEVPYPDVVRVHEICQGLGVGMVGIGPPEK
jgi:biopolymer transport protein ExbD